MEKIIRVVIFAFVMMLTTTALAQNASEGKTIAEVDGINYHGQILEIPKETWKCSIRKACVGIVLNLKPAQYSLLWRDMRAELNGLNVNSEIIDQTVNMAVVADAVDGYLIWKSTTWYGAENKVLYTAGIENRRADQDRLTALFDQVMNLEWKKGESQRALKRDK